MSTLSSIIRIPGSSPNINRTELKWFSFCFLLAPNTREREAAGSFGGLLSSTGFWCPRTVNWTSTLRVPAGRVHLHRSRRVEGMCQHMNPWSSGFWLRGLLTGLNFESEWVLLLDGVCEEKASVAAVVRLSILSQNIGEVQVTIQTHGHSLILTNGNHTWTQQGDKDTADECPWTQRFTEEVTDTSASPAVVVAMLLFYVDVLMFMSLHAGFLLVG